MLFESEDEFAELMPSAGKKRKVIMPVVPSKTKKRYVNSNKFYSVPSNIATKNKAMILNVLKEVWIQMYLFDNYYFVMCYK